MEPVEVGQDEADDQRVGTPSKIGTGIVDLMAETITADPISDILPDSSYPAASLSDGTETKSLGPGLEEATASMEITVDDPKMQGGTLRKYYSYAVTTTPALPGVSSVRRRYRDFVWLRDHLMSYFPGLFIPPLPPKQMLGRFEAKFVQDRAVGLQQFMNRIAHIPYLAQSDVFHMFLKRHSNSLSEGQAEAEAALKARTEDDLSVVREYSDSFPTAISAELPDDPEEGIHRLKAFLEQSKVELAAAVEKLDNMVTKSEETAADAVAVSNFLQNLHKIEDEYAQRPTPARMDAQTEFAEFGQGQKMFSTALKNSLLEKFRTELWDIEAFLSSLKQRDGLKTRVDKLKASVDKWARKAEASGGVLADKDAAKQQSDTANLETSTRLLTVVNKVVLVDQMPRVWRQKVTRFSRAVRDFAKEQVEAARATLSTWEAVASAADL